MSAELPPLTPVTDSRPQPRGIIPRSTQTVLLACGALALIGIVVVFGGKGATVAQKAAAAAIVPPTPTDPERLQHYEQQLRQVPVAAPVTAPELSPATYDTRQPVPVSPYVDAPVYNQPAAKPADPIAEDRQRREYESLFSSNVVSSTRMPTEPTAGRQQPPAQPTTDDIARSVLRAMQPQPPPPQFAQPVPLPMQPQPVLAASAPAVARGPAAGLHRVSEGTLIDAVLLNRLDGSGIAPTVVLITNDVYSQDLTRVIPAGTKVLGTTTAVSSFGAQRLAVAFHRAILPDGRDISLDKFIALNQSGDAGLRDQVNTHLLSTFGISAAIGLIGGLSQAVRNIGRGDGSTVVLGGATDTTSQSVAQTMQQYLNRPPEITIREGHRVKIFLTADLDLNEYTERR